MYDSCSDLVELGKKTYKQPSCSLETLMAKVRLENFSKVDGREELVGCRGAG